MTVSFGQLIFTPADRERVSLDPNDRPYAGWLYTGLGYHARSSHTVHSFEFDLGVVGPASLARQSQNLVHDLWGIRKFQGWDNQLQNEPGIQLVFERKHRIDPRNLGIADNLQLDFINHFGGSLGNVATYFNAGGELRLGWNLPDDFGTSTLRPGADNLTPGLGDADSRPWQMHAFISLDGRALAQDIFLDGNTFRDSHSVDKEYLGIAAAYRRWRLSYSHVYRTREFRTQPRAQEYGSLSLTYGFHR